MTLNTIFLLNLATSFFMMGLIWTIQLVHYPSFHFFDDKDFKKFHIFHNRRISAIVIPVMITEFVTSALLWWNHEYLSLNAIGFYLVCLIWASTGLLSVPTHTKLSAGKDEAMINRLINSNWVRTVLWTVKSVLSAFILLSDF